VKVWTLYLIYFFTILNSNFWTIIALKGCSMATSVLHCQNFRLQITIYPIGYWDYTPQQRYPARIHLFSELLCCIQCTGLCLHCEQLSCAFVHCRIPSRFSYFLNITSLIRKSKTQPSCTILQTVFSCKYYVLMFCKNCSPMSIALEW
jgi:hypothetical protein